MNILLLDNYDSFTYNLAHYIREICGIDSHQNIAHQNISQRNTHTTAQQSRGSQPDSPVHTLDILRNDKITLADVEKYDKIVLSPGPGIPQEAGIMPELIKQYAPTKSIFGVCLGHQAIGEAFGGTLTNLSRVIHGFATSASICADDILFRNVPPTLNVGRYHSWVVASENFPEELEITARDNDGFIMALRHKRYDVRGVQFHPESVLTEHGKTMLQNWLQH
ncbi:MAG: aminodeoxychorismate/anthranilate synthase component II [Candidatus Kapaibacterium sp.]|nr:MAG: aminodeoxychorismate/anthranilate synthase component II [Candidatus Kapabacteria bacterium]